MFVIFNKEYRKFESIMSDLMGKMKKSTRVVQKYNENAEVYELDTVDVIFAFAAQVHMIYVMDKKGAQIISLDCHYDFCDKLQNAKCKLFSNFLKEMRDAYDKRIAKENKLKEAAEKAKKVAEVKQKVISAQQAKEKMLNDALEKLRNL